MKVIMCPVFNVYIWKQKPESDHAICKNLTLMSVKFKYTSQWRVLGKGDSRCQALFC